MSGSAGFPLLPRGDSPLLSGSAQGNRVTQALPELHLKAPSPAPSDRGFLETQLPPLPGMQGSLSSGFVVRGTKSMFLCSFQQLLLLSALFSNSWCVQGFCGMNCLASEWLSYLVALKAPLLSQWPLGHMLFFDITCLVSRLLSVWPCEFVSFIP